MDAALVQFFLYCSTHFIGGAHRHGGLVYDYLVFLHVLTDGMRCRDHILQVGRAILVGRGAYGDELDHAMLRALSHIGRESQSACGHVALDHILQTRLVNRDAALLKSVDLVRVHVHAQHIVTHFSQAGACHQAHIASANYSNFHFLNLNRISCYQTWI